MLNLYAGTPESGNADFFMYKNVLYTLVKSAGVYEAVQKSYTVYAAKPTPDQQQLAVFDLNGTTYMVTDGTTAGARHASRHQSRRPCGPQTASSTPRRSSAWSMGSPRTPINVIAVIRPPASSSSR